jgi:hypothetical protein
MVIWFLALLLSITFPHSNAISDDRYLRLLSCPNNLILRCSANDALYYPVLYHSVLCFT